MSLNSQLIAAIHDQNISLITSLLKSDADPNVRGKFGNTALHMAFNILQCTSECTIVELLLAHGANPNIQNVYGDTILHKIINLIDYNNKRTQCKNKQCKNNHCRTETTIIELLLTHDTDVNLKNKNGDTPLLMSVARSCTTITKLLLLSGTDPNIQDISGTTPLSCYCLRNDINIELITLFLTYGANPNIQNNFGNTTLHYMARHIRSKQFFPTIELLLAHGANPNVVAKNDCTPFDFIYVMNQQHKGYYDATFKKLTCLFDTYNRKLFSLICEGLKQYKLGLNALLLIGQQIVPLPDNDLSVIVLKYQC